MSSPLDDLDPPKRRTRPKLRKDFVEKQKRAKAPPEPPAAPPEPLPPPPPKVSFALPPLPPRDALEAIGPPQVAQRIVLFNPKDMPPEIKSKMGLYAKNAQREMILALTGNGLELMLQALAVLRDETEDWVLDRMTGEPVQVPPSLAAKAEARRWLSEYSYQVVKMLEISGPGGGPIETKKVDLSVFSTEELQQYLKLQQKLRNPPPPESFVDAEYTHTPSAGGARGLVGADSAVVLAPAVAVPAEDPEPAGESVAPEPPVEM